VDGWQGVEGNSAVETSRGTRHEERKIVLKRVAGILEQFVMQGHLQRRSEPQSIGYGNEIGFDYVSPRAAL
jgi:hypothetical protein